MLSRILLILLLLSSLVACHENPSKAKHITEEKEAMTTTEQQMVSLKNGEYLDDDERSVLLEGEDQSQQLKIDTIKQERCMNAFTQSKLLFEKISFGWWKRSANAHESCACHPQTSSK
ncbi:MAG: hypothetical protein HRU41_12070 [Saprospiraceae bacterium]|nr:hypothetical protein [Saprospiraceae bacterium]